MGALSIGHLFIPKGGNTILYFSQLSNLLGTYFLNIDISLVLVFS